MNRLDVIAAAVEHAIPSVRLLLAADVAASGATRHELAGHLAMYGPAEVVTGGGRLVVDDFGITGIGLHGGEPVQVTWVELAGHLLSVMTPRRARDLEAAYQASLDPQNADGGRQLADARASLAYDTVLAAGLLSPSLFAGTLTERTVLDGTDRDGFGGRVTLDPVQSDAVACCVNGGIVAVVKRAAAAHRVTVVVLDGRHPLEPGPSGEWRPWVGTVRHVPPGESAGPLPATFADRVGVEVLDQDATAARWALQVDGFDVVIMEAGATTSGVRPTVRAAVYDNDPGRPFRRYEGRCIVPPPPPQPARPGPRDVGAAVNRSAQYRRVPRSGRGR